MLDVLILFLLSALFAVVLKKNIEKIIPVLLMGCSLLVYLFALITSSLISAVNIVWIIIALLIIAFLTAKAKSGSFAVSETGLRLKEYVLTIPFIVYIITIIAVCFLYTGHLVFDWDDLSYWGIYAKTLLSIDRIPTAISNCTVDYKDYLPIQQIMQYIFLHRFSGINEANLFRVNVGFMYSFMLPFLEGIDKKKSSKLSMALSIALYLIFPHIFTTQFYYKLGIDYLISVLFGYAIYTIVKEANNKAFCLTAVIISSCYMAMIKTSGAFLCILISLFYCAYHWFDTESTSGKIKQSILWFVITFLPSMVFYAGWKHWGNFSGNHGYLSDRVSSNVRSLNFNFPDYTLKVVLLYIKRIFTYPLTRSSIGITAAVMILLIALMYHLSKPDYDNLVSRRLLHIFMCVGLVIFCSAHIYMYLFVFDDWEALGLLEFDRYITQYLAGIFYFYASTIVIRSDALLEKKILKFSPALVLLVVALGLFPYQNFSTYLIPTNYKAYYEENWKPFSDRATNEWNAAKKHFEKINWYPSEDTKVAILADAWTDELQFLLFDMVPQPISFVVNSPAIEEGNLVDFMKNQCKRRNISYIYVMTNAKESHSDEWDPETPGITDNHMPLEEGKLYEVIDNESSPWTLHMID